MTAAAGSTAEAPGSIAWADGDLVVTHVFAAPRALVFRAWSQPEHFARWFGPRGTTLPFCRMDVRPGGTLHYLHRHADGTDVWIRGVYDEVAPPERIAFRCWFSDEGGHRVERPGFPAEMTIIVTLAEHPEGTLSTMWQTGLVTDQGEVQGWKESLDRLASLLADPHTLTKEDR